MQVVTSPPASDTSGGFGHRVAVDVVRRPTLPRRRSAASGAADPAPRAGDECDLAAGPAWRPSLRCARSASLPVGHRRVEGGLLGSGRVDVVLDQDPGPRGPSCSPRTHRWHRAAASGRRRQRICCVGIPDERRRRIDLLLDPALPLAARRRAPGTGCSRRRGSGTRCGGSGRGRPAGTPRCGCRSSRRVESVPRTVHEALVGVHRGSQQHTSSGTHRRTATEEPPQLLRSAHAGHAEVVVAGGPLRPPSHRLRWTWRLDPARSPCGLAMKVTLTPWRSRSP